MTEFFFSCLPFLGKNLSPIADIEKSLCTTVEAHLGAKKDANKSLKQQKVKKNILKTLFFT